MFKKQNLTHPKAAKLATLKLFYLIMAVILGTMATDQESVDERNFINNLSEPITPVTPQKPFHAK